MNSKDCDLPYCRSCVATNNIRKTKVMLRLDKGMVSNLERGETIEYQLSSREWRSLDFDISDKRRREEIEEATSLPNQPLELFSKKELRRKNVHVAQDKEGKKYVMKEGIEAREALLQHEVYKTIQDTQLEGMVPQIVQVNQSSDWIDVTMEYVDGDELAVAMHNMTDGELRDILIVLHLLLHTAYAEDGFVHGDFYPANVLIRRGETRTWSFEVNGENREITLPFYPIVIDFERSSSLSRSYFDAFTSPLTSQSTDILRFYTWMLQYRPDRMPKVITDLVLPIVGEENIADSMDDVDYQYIPLPFGIPSLTHGKIIMLLLDVE